MPLLTLQDPATGRAALLGVKAIGDRHLHDALGPVGACKLRPIRAILQVSDSLEESLPETFLHRCTPPSDRVLSAEAETRGLVCTGCSLWRASRGTLSTCQCGPCVAPARWPFRLRRPPTPDAGINDRARCRAADVSVLIPR